MDVFCPIHKATDDKHNLVVVDVINIDLLSNNCKAKHYGELLTLYGSQHLINEPARSEYEHRSSLLDRLIINLKDDLFTTGVITSDITEQMSIFLDPNGNTVEHETLNKTYHRLEL